MKIQRLENYQLEWLNKKALYIDRYSLEVISLFELNCFWKEFAFDLISLMARKGKTVINTENGTKDLLGYIKKNYQKIIDDNRLPISLVEYPEICDHITLDEWIEEPGNSVGLDSDGFYLQHK